MRQGSYITGSEKKIGKRGRRMTNTHLKEKLSHQKTCNDIRKMSIKVLEDNVELLERKVKEQDQELLIWRIRNSN